MTATSGRTTELLNVGQLFSGNDVYVVPVYQRNYAWQYDQIAQLIHDIQTSCEERFDSYFLGNLIVTKADEKKPEFEVVDGQQRLTTLYLLLAYLRGCDGADGGFQEVRLRYRSRPRASETLRQISADPIRYNGAVLDSESIEDAGIRAGLNAIRQIMARDLKEGKRAEFATFLREKVQVVRARLPPETDLNRYFVIMNTRGQQLQPVDVVKARLMRHLDDADERACFAWIWDACADMGSYLQMSLTRGNTRLRMELFGEDWAWLELSGFDEVLRRKKKCDDDGSEKSSTSMPQGGTTHGQLGGDGSTLDDALAKYETVPQSLPTDDPDSDRFQSTIEFPVFLLHVLSVMPDAEESEGSLDDKQLIKRFEGMNNPDLVRQFAFKLLRCRNLLDSFVLKRQFTSKTGAEGAWSLLRLVKRGTLSKPTAGYKPTFSHSGTSLEEDGDADSATADALLIQSMLRVTYTSPRTMHWITLLLEAIDGMPPGEVSSTRLVQVLEGYSRQKVREAFFDREEPTGFEIARIVFTYLDYLLVKDDPKGFRFTFRNSIEHFYPQNRNQEQSGCDVSEGCINRLGNLALITVGENARFSNNMPKVKVESFAEIIAKSPKLQRMAEITQGEGWGDHQVEGHHEQMVSLLDGDVLGGLVGEFNSIENDMSKDEWKNSKCDVLYFNSKADLSIDYEVIIGDGEIEVSYLHEGERFFYRGREAGPGHYVLHAAGFDGEATLHRFHDGRVLEGYWVEDGERGMWRIQLA